jgi:ligand-binding sensor domain-containing protein
MRLLLFFILYYFFHFNCAAQQNNYSSFTVNDGLPSNYIYGCVEDNKGFLWVATDAGIARFDGKHFQVFTTVQGLPDNEVLTVVKEKNGRIWVNCFKQSPAYFDEVKNRFINASEDSNLAKVNGTGVMYVYALLNGGVMYYNEVGSYIFRDKKLIKYDNELRNANFVIRENNDETQLKFGGRKSSKSKPYQYIIYQTKNKKYLDSIPIRSTSDYLKFGIDEDRFYVYNYSQNQCLVYSRIEVNPLRFKLDSIGLPEPFFSCSFTDSYINFYGGSGKIYVFDKSTLQKVFIMSGDYAPNNLYSDTKENIWVSTIDKGLVLYKKRQIGNIIMPSNFNHTNFLSIGRKQDGSILAGNYYGEILENKGQVNSIHSITKKVQAIIRQRKILLSQNKIFSFSERGVFANYTRQVTTPIAALFYAKTAINFNDTFIIVGYVGGLHLFNSRTEEVTQIKTPYKRITALTKLNDDVIYFGSTDGLYKYDFTSDTCIPLKQTNQLLNERVVALCTTTDNLIWMSTPGNGVLVIKDDKVISQIKESVGINSNSARSITAAKPGQVWVGSSAGISIINYKLHNNTLTHNIQHLSVNDGLTNNVVNEMVYQNDSIYAATADGISVIPAKISIPVFSIPVYLVSVSINQRDTVISNKYDLKSYQQNILVSFAGIELSGHFKNLQYTLDKNKDWVELNENTLNLQLNHGSHILQVRAVDVNGNISDKILSVEFNIATPYWKTLWFWIVIAVVLQSLIIYLVSRWLKKRRQTKLAKEVAGVQTAALEQQAFTSLMNPHFMFNALNSIQHYINVQDRQNANRYLSDFASLIRKNFEAAQQSFIPLEEELDNLKIYLRLETMRFSDRFTYNITVNKNIDTENCMIPTMMLQPLLENALIHGIMPSTIKGVLQMEIQEIENNLCITIIDNGIGMERSRNFQQQKNHKSRGTELIQKRIAALGHFVKEPITIKMSPAFISDHNPGNKTALCIPSALYKAWMAAQKE